MKQYPLIGISIVSVVVLILASLTNVIGYQTVQSSSQNTITNEINQRELSFQTIVDIANNKEIQRIILKSQLSRGIFPTSEFPVVTKNQLKMMYFLGLILSKVISKSRIQSLIGKYQFSNQEVQQEMSTVIEKDTIINSEITQLKDSECDCENENMVQGAYYPFIICLTLFLIIIGLSSVSILVGIFFVVLTTFLQLTFFGLLPTVIIGIAFIPYLLAAYVFKCFDNPSNTEWTNQLDYLRLRK
jgi:hypothetical protein